MKSLRQYYVYRGHTEQMIGYYGKQRQKPNLLQAIKE